MSTISLFGSIKGQHDVYSGKDCIKKCLWIFKRAGDENNYFLKKWSY